MRNAINEILRLIIRIGLKSYYKEIRVKGEENIVKDKAVLFVPNHQNGLIDPLLIGTLCHRKPYYLARSDVFQKPLYNKLLRYIQMMPIYRMRDGRNTLIKNEEIYAECGELLNKQNSIVIFPEGNHGLLRKVRPLKNGFVHILKKALEKNPNLDVYLQPVGFNYEKLAHFPDRVSMLIGPPIRVQDFWDFNDYENTKTLLKKELHKTLCTLTAHINQPDKYEDIVSYLECKGVDFTRPDKVNELMSLLEEQVPKPNRPFDKNRWWNKLSRFLFFLLNFPLLLFWKKGMHPHKIEIEFISTFRFAVALVGYLILALFFGVVIGLYYNAPIAIGALIVHYSCSLLLVKAMR